jgi:DNA polymerase V
VTHDGFETPRITGFPSPAQLWRERGLRLDDILIVNPAATYFLRVGDRSMQGAGIFPGDVVVVDRSVEATHGAIIVANVRDAFTIKRVLYVGDKVLLQSEHYRYPTFEVTPSMRFSIWGVVLFVIHGVHPSLTLDAILGRYRLRERS